MMIAGGIAILIGLSVVTGWHTQTALLVQWSPDFSPTHYLTALGFLFGGAGLIALALNVSRTAAVCGSTVFLIGWATLGAHFFDIHFGVEQFLTGADFMSGIASLGRSSPNSALSLIISGGAVYIASKRQAQKQVLLILGLMGALIVALALAILFGHLRGLQTAYGWASDTRTGVVSMAGFMVLGIGILATAWHLKTWKVSNASNGISALTGLGIVLLSMLLWGALVGQEEAQFKRLVENDATALSREIAPLLQSRIASIERIAKRQAGRNTAEVLEWKSDAVLHVGYYSGQTVMGIADVDLQVKTAVPENKAALLQRMAQASADRLRPALGQRGSGSDAALIQVPGAKVGDTTFLIAVPLENAGLYNGFIMSLFDLKTALAAVVAEKTAHGYSVAITQDGRMLYRSDAPGTPLDKKWGREIPLQIGDATWQVRIWPRAQRLNEAQSDLPETALVVGFVMAFLVMLVLELNFAARNQATELELSAKSLLDEINERKTAQEALEKSTAELARSNRELQQFAYVASHDLQEPLRMVVSYMQLIERRYKEKLDEDGKEFIHFAVDGASRMQQLIQSLLTYSRVGTNAKPFEPTALEKVFEQARSNLHMAIEESGTTITHDRLPTVMADETQLMQLFQNLLGNAIKFRGKDAPRIHVSVEDKRSAWLFTVHDNGIGFDPQYAERIFIIFQRLQRRDEYPGTGIGLSVCKKIVERHGGTIWAESQEGRGATFSFSIPQLEKAVT